MQRVGQLTSKFICFRKRESRREIVVIFSPLCWSNIHLFCFLDLFLKFLSFYNRNQLTTMLRKILLRDPSSLFRTNNSLLKLNRSTRTSFILHNKWVVSKFSKNSNCYIFYNSVSSQIKYHNLYFLRKIISSRKSGLNW